MDSGCVKNILDGSNARHIRERNDGFYEHLRREYRFSDHTSVF